MKTYELTGAALDWAVAKCEGWLDDCNGWLYQATIQEVEDGHYKPSTDWAQGGPIMEREKIRLRFETECYWYFTTPTDTWIANYDGIGEWLGPTPLIAAMRCYVASVLGDEVEIPEDLK